MYTIREIDAETEKVTHVWFLVESIKEAKKIIFRRCFGGYVYFEEERGALIHWWDQFDHSLWYDTYANNRDHTRIYELDDDIGPSTVRRYEVTNED